MSVWTPAGRLKGIPSVCSPETMRLLAPRNGESDLVLRNGTFFLVAAIDIPEPRLFDPAGFLGVDLGIVDIATTSDGQIMSGRKVNRCRKRKRDPRTKLQKKRTTSAARALERNRRKEARYATQRNHTFAQLGAFVEYKAKRGGVPVARVDPRDTSRQRSRCRHTQRTNRVTQARFVCKSCGTIMHADHNGSRNIAHRADAAWQRGAVNRPGTP